MKKASKKLGVIDIGYGRVSAAVLELLRRQVTDRGLVVWYDPQKVYSHLAAQLNAPGTTVLQYESGFFSLRERLEPLLECVNEDGTLKPEADIAPLAVVYVPMSRTDTAYALIEAETAGVVVEPDAASAERNSRLGRMVEEVFKEIAPSKASHLARQADEGLLSVEELDRMAGEAGSAATGALQIVFGHVSAEEMLLQFVAGSTHDKSIEAKSALPELKTLAGSELGWEAAATNCTNDVRSSLRRHLLTTEILLSVDENMRPEALSGLTIPPAAGQRDMATRVTRQWRNRTDLKDAYVEAAEEVEECLGLRTMPWPLSKLADNETFPFLERLFLEQAVSDFVKGNVAAAGDCAERRGTGFWTRERPTWQMGWRVVESAVALNLTSGSVRTILRQRKWELDGLVDAYARHAEPWMRLDRLARDLETRHARWEATGADHESFETLMVRSRGDYADVASLLAETYAEALRRAHFTSARYAGHADTFHNHVLPELAHEGKVAFLMVDALRYEMAAELITGLSGEFDAKMEPILGCLPGVTPVGMAALLPGAENGLLLDTTSSKLDVRIHEQSVVSRAQRLEWLTAKADVPVCIGKLADALKPAFRRRKEFAAAKLIVITSQEIDLLGEEGDEEGIRLYIDDVLEKLRRVLRVLAKAGVNRFVIAADHGFIYAPGVSPGLRMDPPGGRTVELHPRVWIGEGGVSGEGYFRVKASDVTLAGTLELAFPLGLSSFRVKGGSAAYLHGGISPAEHILPLIRLTPAKQTAGLADAALRLSMAKSVITNRLFSVSVTMSSEGLFADGERRVRFEVVTGQKEVGQPVTAAYGFEDSTREVVMKTAQPNVVTLMLNMDTPTVTVRAVDCGSQVVLDMLKDIPVQIGI